MSMIELLVVFVVFGLAVMISIRPVGDNLRRDRIAKAANILGADVEQAFAIAARQRMPVRMVVNDSLRTFSIIDVVDSSKIYRTRSFAKTADYGVDTVYADTSRVTIMPNGIAMRSMNITLQITSNGAPYKKSVSVSTGGMVRVAGR
jgi:Tfp pilus assembly protein FimT